MVLLYIYMSLFILYVSIDLKKTTHNALYLISHSKFIDHFSMRLDFEQ